MFHDPDTDWLPAVVFLVFVAFFLTFAILAMMGAKDW